MKDDCRVVIGPSKDLVKVKFSSYFNYILVSKPDSKVVQYTNCSVKRLPSTMRHLYDDVNIDRILFLSRYDNFQTNIIKEVILPLLFKEIKEDIILLVPYKPPPDIYERIDGGVQSFIMSFKAFQMFPLFRSSFERSIYLISYAYLNSSASTNIQIIQVGKPTRRTFEYSAEDRRNKLRNSSILIPHKGSLALLRRCLFHLNCQGDMPGKMELCFDDDSWKMFKIEEFRELMKISSIYRGSKKKVGPYIPLNFLISKSQSRYIFHLDSDDISVNSRFGNQIVELEERGLDMLGSHELRIDQFAKRLIIVRFPIDVNSALAAFSFHPLLHSTAVIKRSAYSKAGYYSTEGRYGFDTQFLLRSNFFLKIGNSDNFFYLRFLRPKSLTTSHKTGIGNEFRAFLAWRWTIDFKLVLLGKLDIINSSLSEKRLDSRYVLKPIY